MAEKVLVIDDARDIRDFLLNYILKPKGFETLVAMDGEEGLRLALTQQPDLIITDNQMPKMSGLEVLAELNRREQQIPTILTTAYGSEQTAVEAFRLGARDYVIKPFETLEMERSIERALRESRLGKERDQLMNQLMRTNGQLERRVQELNTLYSIGKSVSSSLDLETVLHRVVDAAVFVTGAEEGALMLLDEEQGELFVRASKNLDSDTQTMRLRVRDSLAGQVLKTQQPLFMGDEQKWRKIKTAYLVKSLIYVPLISQKKAIGVLGVSNRVVAQSFLPRHTRVLSTLADYAAMAIYNASLYSGSEMQRRKLGAILSQTDNPVLVLDEKQHFVVVNQAARAAFGLPTEDEIIGLPIEDLLGHKEALEFASQQMGRGGHFDQRAELTMADGRVFNASMTIIEDVGRSVVMHDITQFKELDKLKSEFVSVVSHDLRSPLTAILGYVQLMGRVGPLNEMQQEFAQRVQASVSNITSLITNLLDLGRLEAGMDLTLTDCVVGEILRDIEMELSPMVAEKGVGWELIVADDLPKVWADHNRLQQAFMNLAGNAVKYTPPDGRVRVTAEAHDGQVIVRVSDTGVGISPADQPYIFDKFFRSDTIALDYEGTGLGLSIVKSVVERHDGRIWVESELGRGSSFTVVLPITRQNEDGASWPPAG
jgi:two-component system, OmpR family, phosphate regulon sensor histidine kinase PhoR